MCVTLSGSEIQECPSTFHSWYWKERQDTLQSTHLFSYGKNWCWLQLVLTSLEYSTSINRTIHKFEAQYSLKAFAEDKHSSVILFLNWGSPQMVLLCMTLSGQTQQQRFLCLCSFLILSESCFVAWLHLLINSHIYLFCAVRFLQELLGHPFVRSSTRWKMLTSDFTKSSSRPSFSTLPTSHPMWCTQYMVQTVQLWRSTLIWMHPQEGDHNLVPYLLLTWICAVVTTATKMETSPGHGTCFPV